MEINNLRPTDEATSGLKLCFAVEPAQNICYNIAIANTERQIIPDEIQRLLQKKFYIPLHERRGCMLSVFTWEKWDGSFRMISELKPIQLTHWMWTLKNRVPSKCFEYCKAQSLNGYCGFEICILYCANPSRSSKVSVFGVVQPECGKMRITITPNTDTFYSVFLKLKWPEHCYVFWGMPNGYSEATMLFIKLMKPLHFILRSHGYLSVVLADDSYRQGHTFLHVKWM